jgi:hypothetical protein
MGLPYKRAVIQVGKDAGRTLITALLAVRLGEGLNS